MEFLAKFSVVYTEISKVAPKAALAGMFPLLVHLNLQHKNLTKTTFTALKQEMKELF